MLAVANVNVSAAHEEGANHRRANLGANRERLPSEHRRLVRDPNPLQIARRIESGRDCV